MTDFSPLLKDRLYSDTTFFGSLQALLQIGDESNMEQERKGKCLDMLFEGCSPFHAPFLKVFMLHKMDASHFTG